MPITGRWEPPASTGRNTSFCQAQAGQRVVASSAYSLSGAVAASYEVGSCFYGGSVCTGKVRVGSMYRTPTPVVPDEKVWC